MNLYYKDNTVLEKWDKSGIIGLVNLWGSPDNSWKVSKIDNNVLPTIIVHDTSDESVPYGNSDQLVKELETNEVIHELVMIVGAGHTPVNHFDEFVKKIAESLYDLILQN